jgi:hypothetical protein
MKGILQKQFEMNHRAIHTNVAGLTHAESVRRPEPGGNSLNWVVGHVVATRAGILRLLKAEAVWDDGTAAPYKRGSQGDPEAPLSLERLLQDLDRSQRLIMGALETLPEEALAERGRKDLVGVELGFASFHESYHAGQTGLHRRLLGHAGAIP